jgi:uncharacterized protein with gpF-like domain
MFHTFDVLSYQYINITEYQKNIFTCRCGLEVERLIRNQQVVGSNPSSGFMKEKEKEKEEKKAKEKRKPYF